MKFYALLDNDGFILSISKKELDKFNSVIVPDSWMLEFVKYFDKFRVDEKGILQHPNDLPDIKTQDLSNQVSVMAAVNSQLTDVLSQNALIQAQSSNSIDQVASTLSQLAIASAMSTSNI